MICNNHFLKFFFRRIDIINHLVVSDTLFVSIRSFSKQSLQEYLLPLRFTIRARDLPFLAVPNARLSCMSTRTELYGLKITGRRLRLLEEDQSPSPSNNPVAKSCAHTLTDFLRNESTISIMTRGDRTPINFIGVTQRQI